MVFSDILQYRPLTQRHEIRLVVLKPALSLSHPIKCTLKHVILGQCSSNYKQLNPYEALSYTWGGRNGTIPISCDGQTLLVTPNCESALRHLRNTFTERVLWIDAICINQESMEEKQLQVPLMGRVYNLAKRVIAWLGPGLPGDEAMLVKARIGGWAYSLRDAPGPVLLPENHKNWASKAISPEDIKRIQRICDHEWFGRMWTMQELLLALPAVFQIGRTECPTAALYSVFLVVEGIVESESQVNSAKRRIFRMRNRLLEAVDPESLKKSGWFYSIVTTHLSSVERSAEGFMGLLMNTAAMMDTSDVRDKVYGMIGVLDHATDDFVLPTVDYNKTAVEVFEDFTRCCIRTTGSLWPLEIMACSNSEDGDLPSWVPDLRVPTAICADWQPTLRREAQKECKLDDEEAHEFGKLPIKARYLAEVEEVFSRMPICSNIEVTAERQQNLRTDCLSIWGATVAHMEEQSLKENRYDCLMALKHLTFNLAAIRRRYDSPVLEQDEKTMQTKPGKSKRHETASGRPQTLPEEVYDGAALFYTTCGLFGLCKGDIRDGDVICQVGGGRFPFVLRQTRTGVGEYRFVGIADVYGLSTWSKTFVKGEYERIWLV